MTIDKETYNEIAQTLFNITPDLNKPTHIVCIIGDQNIQQTWWNGDRQAKETSFRPPQDEVLRFNDLFTALHKNTEKLKLAKWNVAHYILAENGKSFDIHYELTELTMHKYCEKFRGESNCKNKVGFIENIKRHLKK